MAQPPGHRVTRRAVSVEERRRILAEEARRGRRAAPQRPSVEMPATAVTAVLMLLAAVVFLVGKRMAPVDALPYQLGVAIGLILTAVYVIGLFQYLQRYGEPRTTAAFLLRGVIVLLAAIGCSLGAIGVLVVLNVRLDRGPEKVNRALVVSKARTTTKTDTYTAVRVAAWWTGDRTVDFTLPDRAYDRIEPRRTYLLVKTRPGAFGWQWVDGAPDVDDSAPAAEATSTATASSSTTDTTASSAPAPAVDEAGDALPPEKAEARALVAKAQQELSGNARDQGIADLKRAIDLDPAFVLAYRFLAEAVAKTEDFDTAIDYWSRLIDLQPKNAAAWNGRVKARLAKKDLNGALGDAEQACRVGGTACDTAQSLRDQLGR